jgi:hypothetical protein
MQSWDRLAEAAVSRGADPVDLEVVGLALRRGLDSAAYLKFSAPMVATRMRAISALHGKKSRVGDAERKLVLDIALRLSPDYTQPTPLYRAVAEETGKSLDRVRYILEGPRRQARKNG